MEHFALFGFMKRISDDSTARNHTSAEEVWADARHFLTFGNPAYSLRQASVLGDLHHVTLAVCAPSGHCANVQAHVDFLQAEWK